MEETVYMKYILIQLLYHINHIKYLNIINNYLTKQSIQACILNIQQFGVKKGYIQYNFLVHYQYYCIVYIKNFIKSNQLNILNNQHHIWMSIVHNLIINSYHYISNTKDIHLHHYQCKMCYLNINISFPVKLSEILQY